MVPYKIRCIIYLWALVSLCNLFRFKIVIGCGEGVGAYGLLVDFFCVFLNNYATFTYRIVLLFIAVE